MSTTKATDTRENGTATLSDHTENLQHASNEHPGIPSRQRNVDSSPQPSETYRREPIAEILYPPPPVWEFNIFLFRLAAKIGETELKRLKHLFTGDIGRGSLDNITTATELFDILRKRMYLNPHNLITLQVMLKELNRPELITLAMEYAEKDEEVLHFYPPSPEPENGRTKIKVHVAGKDYKREYIEKLRIKVSRWLCIPPQHVIIDGIEPSSSMFITILIPDAYAEALRNTLEYKSTCGPLLDLEIDIIQIHEKMYSIGVGEGTEIGVIEEQTKPVNVYEQLQHKIQQLHIPSEEILTLTKEVNVLKKKNDTLETENGTFKNNRATGTAITRIHHRRNTWI